MATTSRATTCAIQLQTTAKRLSARPFAPARVVQNERAVSPTHGETQMPFSARVQNTHSLHASRTHRKPTALSQLLGCTAAAHCSTPTRFSPDLSRWPLHAGWQSHRASQAPSRCKRRHVSNRRHLYGCSAGEGVAPTSADRFSLRDSRCSGGLLVRLLGLGGCGIRALCPGGRACVHLQSFPVDLASQRDEWHQHHPVPVP